MSAVKGIIGAAPELVAKAYEAAAGVGPQVEARAAGGFGQTLARLVGDVDRLQDHSGEVTRRLVAGEHTDAHEVMVATEEAGLAFSLMVEVRNKLLEAYQELMRMQV